MHKCKNTCTKYVNHVLYISYIYICNKCHAELSMVKTWARAVNICRGSTPAYDTVIVSLKGLAGSTVPLTTGSYRALQGFISCPN